MVGTSDAELVLSNTEHTKGLVMSTRVSLLNNIFGRRDKSRTTKTRRDSSHKAVTLSRVKKIVYIFELCTRIDSSIQMYYNIFLDFHK